MPKRQPTRWPNVKRYPDGTYYAIIKPLHDGPSREISLRTKKAMQVPDALKIAELKVQRGHYAGSRLRFEQVIYQYLEERKKDWKPRTYSENTAIAERYLIPFFGRMKLNDIDHNAWEAFTKKRVIGDYMNSRYVLTNCLTWAAYKNWVPPQPLVFKLPKHKRRQRRILKPIEIKAIIGACEGKIELFIHLTLFHGLRGQEATLRKFTEVDEARGCLLIPDSKTNTARAIPLLHYTLDLIKLELCKTKSPYLFPNRKNRLKPAGQGWFRKAWARTLKQAGLVDKEGTPDNITPHDLRATAEKYASKLTRFTRTEREKMFGSSVEVQDNIYITEFFVDELRGLEAAMFDKEKGIEGLDKIIQSKRFGLGKDWEDKSENTRNLQ